MSCLMTRPESIATLAETISRVSHSGYELYGISTGAKLWTALRDLGCSNDFGYLDAKPVAEALHRVNVAAYNGRYEEHQQPDTVPDYNNIKPAFDVPRCRYDGRWIYDDPHYRFAGLLDFFNYQCEEDATRNNLLCVGLREFADRWKHQIIASDPRYTWDGNC